MSTLINSFLIEPVVRQARRLSGAPSTTGNADARSAQEAQDDGAEAEAGPSHAGRRLSLSHESVLAATPPAPSISDAGTSAQDEMTPQPPTYPRLNPRALLNIDAGVAGLLTANLRGYLFRESAALSPIAAEGEEASSNSSTTCVPVVDTTSASHRTVNSTGSISTTSYATRHSASSSVDSLEGPPMFPPETDMSLNPALDTFPAEFQQPSGSASEHRRSLARRTDSNGSSTSDGSPSRPGRNSHRNGGSRSSLGNGLAGHNRALMSAALPEDDGMASLRQKIQEINKLSASSEEKAKQLHQLMTEDWNMAKEERKKAFGGIRPQSPASGDRPFTPLSMDVDMMASSPKSPALSVQSAETAAYNMTAEEMQPSYRPHKSGGTETPPNSHQSHAAEGDRTPEDPETPELGCQHYKRNVKVQCYDCKHWYPCRHCHDVEEQHMLNRRKTENMFCMLCLTPQPAGQTCRSCAVDTAWYYCDICKLWDDDTSKKIYHCTDCGICRRGEGLGKDYYHCKKCNLCISIAFATSHKCIERATDCDCPICGEYMFNSSEQVISLPCGHYLHQECRSEYFNTAYRCPICAKSAVNMELQWRKLDHSIESQPMPSGFREMRAFIQCNDCSAKSEVPYHWLGCKCTTCDSYNTNELRLINAAEGAAEEAAREAERREVERARAVRLNNYARPRSYFREPSAERGRESPATAVAESSQARPVTAGTGADAREESPFFLPYEVLARVSRSLSPMRNYLYGVDGGERDAEGELRPRPQPSAAGWRDFVRRYYNENYYRDNEQEEDVESINGHMRRLSHRNQEDDEDDDLNFFGADGRFLSGEEVSDDEMDDDDEMDTEDDSMGDASGEEMDEDSDGDADGDVIDIPGHR